VERFTKADPACTLAAAAAHAFNEELTVILSSVSTLLHELAADDPARVPLLELREAALRCATKTARMLRFGARRARAMRMPLDRLIQDE